MGTSDLDLDVRFTRYSTPAARVASEDCTGDGCGGTEDSAGVTC
ncbi:hypothetical protein [Acrocarpospora catenulata]|nr:hypothetical protein [Acrocarpospora catenulata]